MGAAASSWDASKHPQSPRQRGWLYQPVSLVFQLEAAAPRRRLS
jgi:hypothetical protein